MGRYTTGTKTLEWCRKKKWFPWKVEIFNSFSGFKTDLYYIIDYLAITNDRTIGVQSCGADFATHITKLIVYERENTIKWLQSRELVLMGWRKVKRRGRMVYRARIAWFYYRNQKLFFIEKDE